jgi:peptidoglycan/LPS O-acetylase OafA/YrhL
MDAPKFPLDTKKLNLIEGARFILALMVVLWHYYYFGPLSGDVSAIPFRRGIFPFLSFAVEAFFIVSGLVIVISAVNRRPMKFAVQRLLRLGPALLICATTTFLVCRVAGNGHHKLDFGDVQSYLSSILVAPLFIQDGLDGSLWTLKYELRFYFLIFLFIAFFDIRSNATKLAFALIAFDLFILLAELTGFSHLFLLRVAKAYLYVHTVYFALGILIYAMRVNNEKDWKTLALVGVATLLAAYRATEEANRIAAMMHQKAVTEAAGFVISAVCFLSILVCARSVNNLVATKALLILGAVSYPLYLVHQDVGYRLIKLFSERAPSIGDSRPIVVLIALVAAYLIAAYGEPTIKRFYRSALERWLIGNSRATE